MDTEIRVGECRNTMAKPPLNFIWQGVSGCYGTLKDGLYAALKLLENDYDILYKEPWDEIGEGIVLYWEAPVTIQGKNAEHYRRIMNLPNKKILLFAGGPLNPDWVKGFDLVLVESEINEKECEQYGITYKRAFGVNTEIFKPIKREKKYKAIHHGTCASWKRQNLLCNTFKSEALVVGRDQPEDPAMFTECRAQGATVLGSQPPEIVAELLNESMVLVQSSDYWGGGQRATLEAMACGIQVVAMADSPKNREFVEESGFGAVCEPNEEAIRNAVDELIARNLDPQIGVDYVNSKWTEKHYYEALKQAIHEVNHRGE